MTLDNATGSASEEDRNTSTPETALARGLKVVVVGLGVLLVVGFAVVVARIIYLASRPGAQSDRPAAMDWRLELPADASIRSLAFSGDRLAVHYDSPRGPGIAIIDVASGRTLARVRVAPEVPRQ